MRFVISFSFVAGLLVAGLLVAGCGSSTSNETPPSAEARDDATSGRDAESAPRTPVSCSATAADTRGRPCADGATCTVETGTCSCPPNLIYPPHCGGAPSSLPPIHQPSVWVCTPEDLAEDRGDGCPFETPLVGSACSPTGRSCRYGGNDGCGHFAGAVATCNAATWTVEVTHPLVYQ